MLQFSRRYRFGGAFLARRTAANVDSLRCSTTSKVVTLLFLFRLSDAVSGLLRAADPAAADSDPLGRTYTGEEKSKVQAWLGCFGNFVPVSASLLLYRL